MYFTGYYKLQSSLLYARPAITFIPSPSVNTEQSAHVESLPDSESSSTPVLSIPSMTPNQKNNFLLFDT